MEQMQNTPSSQIIPPGIGPSFRRRTTVQDSHPHRNSRITVTTTTAPTGNEVISVTAPHSPLVAGTNPARCIHGFKLIAMRRRQAQNHPQAEPGGGQLRHRHPVRSVLVRQTPAAANPTARTPPPCSGVGALNNAHRRITKRFEKDCQQELKEERPQASIPLAATQAYRLGADIQVPQDPLQIRQVVRQVL